MSMSAYRTVLTRSGDTGYALCGCEINLTKDFCWAVSRDGTEVGTARTFAEAKKLARLPYPPIAALAEVTA